MVSDAHPLPPSPHLKGLVPLEEDNVEAVEVRGAALNPLDIVGAKLDPLVAPLLLLHHRKGPPQHVDLACGMWVARSARGSAQSKRGAAGEETKTHANTQSFSNHEKHTSIRRCFIDENMPPMSM